jgi:cell division protein FtsL
VNKKIETMRFQKLIIFHLFVALGFVSCKKDYYKLEWKLDEGQKSIMKQSMSLMDLAYQK